MALLEKEAIRFAESLDDYEHVTVEDVGGYDPIGFLARRSRSPFRGRLRDRIALRLLGLHRSAGV